MGRVCSKVAHQETTSPSSLQCVSTTLPPAPEVLQDLIARLAPETGPLKFLTNRLQLKIQEIQIGRPGTDLKPPHAQVYTPPLLSDGFNFYVSFLELQIAGLSQTITSVESATGSSPLPSPPLTQAHLRTGGTSGARLGVQSSEYVALVSWDNNAHFIRTTFERLDEHGLLKFPGHWSFLWSFQGAARLNEMKDRYLLVALFKIEHLRNASLVGYSLIDILSITVGPVHHDFAFTRWNSNLSGNAGARMQFECRLTQICTVNCIPVEVSVAVDSSALLPSLTSSEPLSVGTPPSQTAGLSPSKSPLSPETPQTSAVLMSRRLENDEAFASTNSGVSAVGAPNPADLIPKSKSVCDLATLTRKDTGSVPQPVAETSSTLQRRGSSTLAEVDQLDAPKQMHTTDEEKCVVKAEWKVDISVTGLTNSVPAASTWSSVTSEPYWFALDPSVNKPPTGTSIITPIGQEGILRPNECTSLIRSTSAYAMAGATTTGGEAVSSSGDGNSPLSQTKKNSGSGKKSLSGNASLPPESPFQQQYRASAVACQQSPFTSFLDLAYPKTNACLKPFYLQTTSEGLRRYHLILRLWHKPLGVGAAKLYGEALIPFFKLFDADSVQCRSFVDVKFTETLWSDGRSVGEVSAVLVFQDIPVVRQMFAGISTELGYRRLISPNDGCAGIGAYPPSSESIENDDDAIVHVTPEIATLSRLTGELECHWLRTNVIHAEKVKDLVEEDVDTAASRLLRPTSQPAPCRKRPKPPPSIPPVSDLSDICETIGELLSQNVMFKYPSLKSLVEGQRVLLGLANQILISQDHLPFNLRLSLGNILILVLKRAEFDIANLLPALPKQYQGASAVLSPVAPPPARLRIAADYLELLYKLLVTVNEKIESEFIFESQRRQLATYYSILYIRIPGLRTRILKEILTEEEREWPITEWRGIDFNLDAATLHKTDSWWTKTELQLYLDWKPLHDVVKEHFTGDEDFDCDRRVAQIFEKQPRSLAWLHSRSLTFHLFLNSFIRLTLSQLEFVTTGTAPTSGVAGPSAAQWITQTPSRRQILDNLRWDLIPGYATLLKAFLLELKSKPVTKLSDALLNCSASLLINERLLTVFMRIVLMRSSVYSREQVFSAFNYMDFWLEVFKLKSLSLPITMDYRLLARAVDSVIVTDLALQTAKSLWFLYKRMDLFITQKSMLKIIIEILLYKHYNKLILHWSWLVRKCFTHFILYRVCENARRIVARYASIAGTGTPIKITTEERFLLWFYIIVSESNQAIRIPPVFPEKFATVSLRRLLGQPLPDDQTHAASTLVWSIPAVLPSVNIAKPLGHTTPLSPAKEPSSGTAGGYSRNWIIRRPTGFKFRKRKSNKDMFGGEHDVDVLLLDPSGIDDIPTFVYESPAKYLPPALAISDVMKPYIQHITAEFAFEVEQYKLWVISGKAEVPPMHIPASPLDTNVDVPLDDD